VPEREPEYARSVNGELRPLRMALKHLVLSQQELGRRLARLEPEPAQEDSEESHGPHRPGPRVSVILTVYNYARYVGGAICSVARSNFEDFELVVIEDASSDDSLEAVREALAACPWVPARLVARGTNRGLPRARNLGLELAQGEFVFILDADNEVYPHCLGRLVETLDDDEDLSFAYGILEAFDWQGPQDLMSWLAWEPARLRYGNFVDAMAMIRREAALNHGGYVTDPRLHGWEDFALWCALADSRQRGRLVPEIVARYRRMPGSMLSLTNIDATNAWAALVERYPVLTEHPAAVA
jgi:glycosyltransferase involved in cell wall biosynthesis